MRKTLATAVALIFLATPLAAKPKHFYSDKKWWIGVGVIGAVALLDGISSEHAYNRGAVEVGWDASPLIGAHPSPAASAGYCFGEFAVGAAFHWGAWKATHNDTSKYWRFAGYTTVPAIWTGIGTPTIVNNFRFPNN